MSGVFGETYRRSDGGIGRVHRATRDDVSPVHKHWEPGGYNGKCGWCWLGASHSVDAHEAKVGAP